MFACSGGVMNESRFTKVYLDSLNRAHPDMEFAVKGHLEIEATQGEASATLYLDNAYKEYTANPSDAGEVISRYLSANSSGFASMSGDAAVDPSRIFPVVRSEEFYNGVTELDAEVLAQRYNEDLMILFVEDTETSMSYLSEGSIEGLVAQDTLLQFALRNLVANLPDVEKHGDGPVYMLTAGGDYEASLMLLASVWERDNLPAEGDIIVAVPNRDLLLVTDSKSPDGVAKLAELTKKQYEEGSHSVSPNLYRWNGVRFEPYKK